MIDVDGSQKSGSGTILRLAVALAAILGEPLHICNIRRSRPQPGLRPQHLEAVLTAAKLCGAKLHGARIGSRELWFMPDKVKGGKIEAEIGTAGSISMLLMTVLPICTFAKETVQLHVVRGGTDVSHSPTINYMRFVFLRVLDHLGIKAAITVRKYGYYPKGMGEVTMIVEPCTSLSSFRLESFGEVTGVKGVSVCTFLKDRKVAHRQAKAASNYLAEKGYPTDIQVVDDESNPLQKGSSLVLWAETNTGAIIGADAIGEIGKASEAVGCEAAESIWKEISAKPTVDVHLADMLIPYVALAKGGFTYHTREITDHLETNIWLAEKILNARFDIKQIDGLYRIEKSA